jgi:iron-sulfur cluster repair protein YtfE (RIC family)
MSDQPTDLFRHEHEALLGDMEQIRTFARELPRLSLGERAVALDRVLTFLRRGLGPHAEAEEKFLYPEFARILGNPNALAPMSYDHMTVSRWTEALAQADHADTDLLQELLYGLHALIRIHLWKEEEIYFPLLDAQPAAEVRRTLEALEELEAAARAR